jgi:TolB-like protein
MTPFTLTGEGFHMKRFRVLSIALLSLFVFTSCAGVHPPAQPGPDLSAYRSWIVLPFQTQGFLDRYGSEIADQVVIELMKEKPSLRVLDRAAARTNRGDGGSGGDSLDIDNVPLGQMGVDLALVGSVLAQIETLNRGDAVRQAYVTATIRAVDAKTGAVVWAERISETAEYRIRDYTYLSDSELREEAITRLAAKIARTVTGH